MFTSTSSAPDAAPAAQWCVHVSASFLKLGTTHYHADLFRDDEWMCRISLTQPVPTRAAAERILDERCRHWIAGWQRRARPGYTPFRDLDGRRPLSVAC